MAVSTPKCADCGAQRELLFPWPFIDCPRIHLCGSCRCARQLQDEIDQQNAVALATTICQLWWAILVYAEGRAA
jgi:hypothetical protein